MTLREFTEAFLRRQEAEAALVEIAEIMKRLGQPERDEEQANPQNRSAA